MGNLPSMPELKGSTGPQGPPGLKGNDYTSLTINDYNALSNNSVLVGNILNSPDLQTYINNISTTNLQNNSIYCGPGSSTCNIKDNRISVTASGINLAATPWSIQVFNNTGASVSTSSLCFAYNNTGIICANSDGTYTPTRVVGPTGPAGTCV